MRWLTALLLCLLSAPLVAKPRLQVVFSPDGGFDPINKGTKMPLVDGTLADPNLNVMADDMIRRVQKGGRVEIAMYAFSDMNALASMVERARGGVAIRLVLDACAEWTADLRRMVFSELKKRAAEAKADGAPFDFQVEEIPCRKFRAFGRSKKLSDGKVITGTMHEKFGVFFKSHRKQPSNSFAGSSNFARAAASLYGENRTFFWDDPVAAAQLHEEFQRLWKYWGECSFVGHSEDQRACEAVGPIRDVRPGKNDVRMVFNGEPEFGGDPVDPQKVKRWRRIDRELERVLDGVDKRQGTIDFTMFSFTHHGLKDKLLELATRYPRVKVRVMFDLSMLADDNVDRPGVLGPELEREAKKRRLENFEVRYKWRSNAHAYDPEHPEIPPGLYHFKSHLLHHKLVIVNRDTVANGSYNWSGGGERRNLENIQIFQKGRPGHDEIVEQFVREYDAIWSSPGPEDTPRDQFRPNPMMVTGAQGRDLQKRIVKVLLMPGAREIQAALDKDPKTFKDPADVAKEAGRALAETEGVLEAMRDVTLLRRDRRGRYTLAD